MTRKSNWVVAAGLIIALAVAARADDAGDKVEPNVGKGRVVNADGEPIKGVEVSLENTLFLGHAVVKTDKDGRYRADLTRGSFHVTARVTRVYHDTRYVMECTPEDDDDFNGPDGAVRNFTWKLTGPRPDGLGTYGSPVVAYSDLNDNSFEMRNVELTITPDGPLIDGSKGKKIAQKLKNSPDGWCIKDVGVGRYVVSARLDEPGHKSVPLKIRVRNGDGEYVDSVATDFIHNGPLDSLFKLEVEVKRGD